jgi:hypothetical protein
MLQTTVTVVLVVIGVVVLALAALFASVWRQSLRQPPPSR